MQVMPDSPPTATPPLPGRSALERVAVTVSPELDPHKLEQLLARCGIAAEFIDFGGNTVHTPLENRLHILAAMGIRVESAAQLDALLERAAAPLSGFAEPVVVVAAGQPCSLALSGLAAPCSWRLQLEDGGQRRGSLQPGAVVQLELDALPAGYHRLEVDAELERRNVELVAAPPTVWQPPALAEGARLWGLSVQLYTLRSPANWGIGDFADLLELCRAAAGQGADFILLNPLHCPDPAHPENASPYSPDDRRFLNPLYLHLPHCEDYTHPLVQSLVRDATFQARLQGLRAVDFVDYPTIVALKRQVLSLLYALFCERPADDPGMRRFHDFLAAEGQPLADFAAFQAARFPGEGDAMGDPRFHTWLQWQASLQLTACQNLCRELGMRIGLVQDLAVGSIAEGCEVQTSLDSYCLAARIGAPPDCFNPEGQNWGLPPLRPEALAADGGRFFRRLLRANMRGCGALRIDHVMSLMRLWWCLDDGSNADGAYVHYPVDLMFAILRLESQRHQCLVIGEDLGVVPPRIRDYLDGGGVYSNCLFYFEKYDGWHFRRPEHYKPQALAMITNHDVPPLESWWQARDLELRRSLGIIPDANKYDDECRWRQGEKGEVLAWLRDLGLLPASWEGADAERPLDEALKCALARACGRFASRLVSLQLDDLAGADTPVNIPGTHREYPNWRRKLPLETGAIFGSTMALGMMKALQAGRHE